MNRRLRQNSTEPPAAPPAEQLSSIHRSSQGRGVSHTDILTGMNNQAAGNKPGVLPASIMRAQIV